MIRYSRLHSLAVRCSFLAATVLLLGIGWTRPVHAGLVDGGGDLANDLNNAVRFDPSTPTNVIVAYKDANLPLDRYIQVGFRTNNASSINVTSIAWSRDNLSYTDFAPENFVNNINSPSTYVYSPIVDLGEPIGGTSNSLFYLRYTLPSGINVGKVVQSNFLANSNAFATNGMLDNAVNNNFLSITRSHTAVPEPGSILLACSAGGVFAWRLRKRGRSSKAST
jgi:hypothetical protein